MYSHRCPLQKLIAPNPATTAWDVPQTSTGFFPFELHYSQQSQGILDFIQEMWGELPHQADKVVSYVLNLQEKLKLPGEFAQENLRWAQTSQEVHYNKHVQLSKFNTGIRCSNFCHPPYQNG